MPQVELEPAECEFLANVLINVSGPGISMAVVQPLVVKLLSQAPLAKPNSIQVKDQAKEESATKHA